MKYSLALTAASALLASASPLAKRILVTDFVYEVVTVTVTASESIPTISSTPVVEKPKTTQPPPPPPAAAASVSKAPEPKPKPKPKPQPKPVTKPAPKPEPKPAPAPVPQPGPSQPTEAKPTEQPTTGGDYASVVLHQHNVHRFNHSAPALAWDDTLAGYAENTAKTCVFAHDMNQGKGGYGQNLASQGSTGNLGDKAHGAAVGITESWYNGEFPNWQFYGDDNPPSNVPLDGFGHFTQVVWKSSTKVGCATVECPSGSIFNGFASLYTVCNYDPPGNFGGQYGSNVLKPLGQSILTV